MVLIPDVTSLLRQLGLKEAEVSIYFALLQSKYGLFISQITEQTKLKRSTINILVEHLEKKGFITHHLEGKRKVYTAESLESIVFRFEDLLTDLRQILPLLNMAMTGDQQTRMQFFEGKEGVENIFRDILLTMKLDKNPQKEILTISSGEDMLVILPHHEKQFIAKRIKEQIPIRWIAPDNEISKKYAKKKEEYRVMKFFDAHKYPFKIEIDVYKNKIALISWNIQHPTGIIIQDTALADSTTSLFNLVWNSLVNTK